jgi:hypothetical protein
MRSKTYGDKQREAQRQKKQDEEWKKANPEPAPAVERPIADADKKGQGSTKPSRKKESDRRSA